MQQPIPEVGGKTWDELEVKTHESGRLMFPAEIRRRKADGSVESVKVRVCVQNPQDKILARATARAWFRQIKDLDFERDKDLFLEMEQVCILAQALRTHAEPHSQFATHDELAQYDEQSLRDLRERLTLFEAMLDPRESVLDEETAWRKIFAVARGSTLLPLNDIAGHEQPSLVLRMAKEACHSPTGRRFAQSFGISTREPAPFPSSAES